MKWLIGMPRSSSMALTRLFGPSAPLFKAASIFWYEPDVRLLAGIGENRSRGIERIDAVPLAGSRCRTIMMSASVPEWPIDDPYCSCSSGVRPWRVSLPISRMFSGMRPFESLAIVLLTWPPPTVSFSGVRSGAGRCRDVRRSRDARSRTRKPPRLSPGGRPPVGADEDASWPPAPRPDYNLEGTFEGAGVSAEGWTRCLGTVFT